LSERYLERSFAHDPGFAALQGRHERDGQIVDLSSPAIASWAAELARFRAEAQQLEGGLDPERGFEREALLANVDAALFWSERVQEHRRSPLVYTNALDPMVYLTRAYAPLAQRMSAFSKHARAMPQVVAAMKKNLVLPLPRSFVEVGVQILAGLVPYLQRDVPAIFASVDDRAAQSELRAAIAVGVAAVEDGKSWLEAQRAHANESFALGPSLFRELLWATERIDTPLAELKAAGQSDLARNLAALRERCAQLLPGGSLAQCAALIMEDKPAAGPLVTAREQVAMLRDFVVEHELASIPGSEEAHVEEAPPFKRWNQAFIEIPGPYERNLPAVYYIAPPDPSWSAAEREAYVPGRFDLMFISVHEVWPGHFLQFLHANRAPRPFARVFVGYAFAEGWAHYTEELVWEAGLSGGDVRAHVGQLLNALLRNVRFLSALGLHTEGMSITESERMFQEHALTDPANARQQAARGTFDPAYLNYTLGKLVIRKLRSDWLAAHPGGSLRDFHDRFLSFGGPPLPLVRKAMLGRADGAL